MNKSIPRSMLEEHSKISKLLNEFEKESTKNIVKAREIFEKFKWILEKHFFVEEKVIFTIFDTTEKAESEDILTLLKEHKDILFLIKKAEDELIKNKAPNISELKSVLLNHASFEDKTLYPRLEEELSEEQKKLITDRLGEIKS